MCGSSSALICSAALAVSRHTSYLGTYNGKHNMRLRREVFKKLQVLDSADDGLHAEGLEFGGLLLITDERCDFQRLGCRALEESSEDRSANIA